MESEDDVLSDDDIIKDRRFSSRAAYVLVIGGALFLAWLSDTRMERAIYLSTAGLAFVISTELAKQSAFLGLFMSQLFKALGSFVDERLTDSRTDQN